MKAALDCNTNSPCRYLSKCKEDSIENMHTDVRVLRVHWVDKIGKFHEASVFLLLVFHSIILLRKPNSESQAFSCGFYWVSPPTVFSFVCLFVCLFINLHYGRTTGKIALTEKKTSRLNLTRGKKIL